jgi:hypothetical protein
MERKYRSPKRRRTDLILARRIGREVVPMPPLGMFAKLDLAYATKEAERQMYDRWDELTEERNHWKDGVLDELVPLPTEADQDGSEPS